MSILAKRLLPLPGGGTGVFGLVHIEDAARATVAALQSPPGVYNVVDDVPAPASEWMPMAAQLVGAKPPVKISRSVARLIAGKYLVYLMCDQPAVSNERARAELGWVPTYPDWHDGLRTALSTA